MRQECEMRSDLKFIVDYCIILKFLLRSHLNLCFASSKFLCLPPPRVRIINYLELMLVGSPVCTGCCRMGFNNLSYAVFDDEEYSCVQISVTF